MKENKTLNSVEGAVELHNKIIDIIDQNSPSTIMTSLVITMAEVLIQNPKRNPNIEEEVDKFMELTSNLLKEYCVELVKETENK